VTDNPIPVTQTEMVARINYMLRPKGQEIVKSKSSGEKSNWGDFYIRLVNDPNNKKDVVEHHINLEAYAQKNGVMKDSEVIQETKP
jgi:hypothetical protein